MTVKEREMTLRKTATDVRSATSLEPASQVALSTALARPKSIQYLKNTREARESAKDFIELSRQILVAQI